MRPPWSDSFVVHHHGCHQHDESWWRCAESLWLCLHGIFCSVFSKVSRVAVGCVSRVRVSTLDRPVLVAKFYDISGVTLVANLKGILQPTLIAVNNKER